ncbi:hypothetical protein EDB81DRAFT_183572 [Dactylonectria macrodidyma]|uniref:Uncharacterized protein n=1 Tax=Dactylonectria macrodidyma TaxID=307937 RepID=A0A9P9FRA2_9HYPO|nr:hypothetical protein EDB81DRAFT_183572 [Dactylonectria macrodidyma]
MRTIKPAWACQKGILRTKERHDLRQAGIAGRLGSQPARAMPARRAGPGWDGKLGCGIMACKFKIEAWRASPDTTITADRPCRAHCGTASRPIRRPVAPRIDPRINRKRKKSRAPDQPVVQLANQLRLKPSSPSVCHSTFALGPPDGPASGQPWHASPCVGLLTLLWHPPGCSHELVRRLTFKGLLMPRRLLPVPSPQPCLFIPVPLHSLEARLYSLSQFEIYSLKQHHD